MTTIATTTVPAGPSTLDRLRDPSEKTLGFMLLAPAFLLLSLIVVYPIGKLIVNSFFDLRLSGGAGSKFVGLENYLLVFKDPDFWNATKNTVLITLITVPGALVVGMGLAMLANLPFKRRWPVRLPAARCARPGHRRPAHTPAGGGSVRGGPAAARRPARRTHRI